MNKLIKAASVLTVLLGFVFVGQAHALQVVKSGNLQMSVGGLIQVMGETEYVSNDPIGNNLRLYLWNTADSLYTSGSYNGFAWRLETTYGGTTNTNGSGNYINGILDLTDAYVDIPLMNNAMYLKVGQFRDPTNLESATSNSAMLFTEKSPNFNLFFNAGYEMGVALVGHFGNFNSVFGVVQGAPSLPQRYLPEQLNMPLPMFLRIGYSNGIAADPFHQKQTGFSTPNALEYAVHLNGFVARDSNAGHGDLFSRMGSGIATFDYNQDYNGNVLLSSLYNPYLGIAAANTAMSWYYQTSVDFQVRSPMGGGKTLALQGQGSLGHFGAGPFALTVYGGELIGSLQQPKWSYAARVAMVVPDSGLTNSGATIFANTAPIWEVTPSVTYTFNRFAKLTTEVMMMFNEPESQDVDGNYVVAEMPSESSASRAANIAAAFVPIGRMMMQLSF